MAGCCALCRITNRPQLQTRLAYILPDRMGSNARKGAATVKINTQQARDLAEASFKKKEAQLREGQKAVAEYNADRLAVRERTARLRALRLRREADEASRAPTTPAGSADKR
jgi:hypothetical protein